MSTVPEPMLPREQSFHLRFRLNKKGQEEISSVVFVRADPADSCGSAGSARGDARNAVGLTAEGLLHAAQQMAAGNEAFRLGFIKLADELRGAP